MYRLMSKIVSEQFTLLAGDYPFDKVGNEKVSVSNKTKAAAKPVTNRSSSVSSSEESNADTVNVKPQKPTPKVISKKSTSESASATERKLLC